jgi:hypothetical protein
MTKPSLEDAGVRQYAEPVNGTPAALRGSRRTLRLGLATIAVAACLLLSGCFGAPALLGGGTGGGGSSGGSDSGSSDSGSTDDAGSGSDSSDSENDVPVQFEGMPATFPGDIPLISGEVVFGIDVGTGWSVLIAVDDLEADFVDAADRLKAAGYESLLETVAGTGSFGAFENDLYQIQLTTQDSEDYGLVVSYLVVRR